MGGETSKPVAGVNTASKKAARDARFDFFLTKAAKENQTGSSEILKPAFVHQFPDYAAILAEAFFDHITHANNSEHQPTEVVSQQQCYEALLQVQSLTSMQSQLEFYIRVFCGGDDVSEEGILSLLETAFTISMNSTGIVYTWAETDKTVIKELTQIIVSKTSITSAVSWMDRTCPNLFNTMHLFFLNNFYRGKEEEHHVSAIDSEIFDGRLLSMSRWWLLTSAPPSCFTQLLGQGSQQVAGASVTDGQNEETTEAFHWSILYSSQDHGLSLNRFKHHVFGYRGPTVLMITCDGGYVYAAAIDTEWRESVQAWGGANCHLVRLSPNCQILEATRQLVDLVSVAEGPVVSSAQKVSEGDNMVVFNEKSRTIPKGMWIGRDSRNRKLHIEEDFDKVTHNFQTSAIKCMEVWGCGDSSAKAAQSRQKKAERKDAEKHSKVKLPGNWDENPDKSILEMGGVKVNHAEYAK